VTLEGVNSARVNGFLIQTIPPTYNSFTEEKSSNANLTTGFNQLCTVSPCILVIKLMLKKRLNGVDVSSKGVGTAGATGGRNIETVGAKVFFRPHNNLPSLSAVNSPEEPKMHQNSWRPRICPGPHYKSLHPSLILLKLVEKTLTPKIPTPCSSLRPLSFGLRHWRHQLWGTGARAPLDFQLVFVIGVGAQSTLRAKHFCPKIYA